MATKPPSIRKRQDRDRVAIVEQLKQSPIVQIACGKVGISRATYYRWYEEDLVFANQCDEAIYAGRRLINDLAESQLVTLIKSGNLAAAIFWLKQHHADYTIPGKRMRGQKDIMPTLVEFIGGPPFPNKNE